MNDKNFQLGIKGKNNETFQKHVFELPEVIPEVIFRKTINNNGKPVKIGNTYAES